MKRCAIKGITRDKEYNLTKGTPKSEILHLSVNPNGEAEVLKIYFKPRPRLKKVIVDLDFATLAIKGRQSQGNLFSRYAIHKITIKKKGTSTLSAQEIFWDEDIRKLNSEGRGRSLGMFKGDDKIVVWTAKHQYYITGFDTAQHFPDDTIMVEKYNSARIYNLCYFDREQGYYYMKRFQLDMTDRLLPFLDEEGNADFVAICSRNGATLRITYKGNNATRPADEIAVDEFVGVKSRKAKGKRLTTYDVDTLTFIEPEEPEELDEEIVEPEELETVEAGDDGIDEAAESVVLMTEEEEYSASQLDLFS
jgi:topoisomerase-4 subunit A